MEIVVMALRGFQLIFGFVVIGLSAQLVKGQVYGDSPISLRYSIFAGAFGVITGAISLAAVFFDAIAAIIVMAIDALAIFFYIAGGIILAYKLRGINCTSESRKNLEKMANNDLLNEGCTGKGSRRTCGVGESGDPNKALDELKSRCKMNQADSVFMFLSLLVIAAAAAMMFLRSRRK